MRATHGRQDCPGAPLMDASGAREWHSWMLWAPMSDTHGPVGAPVRRFGAPMSVTRGRLGAPMSATRGSFVAPMSATHGSFVRHSWTLLSSTPERR